MLQIGDKVKMNDKYYVSDSNKGKVFTVRTEPQEVCGTLSVWLEGYRGCYAVDGLTKVEDDVAIKDGFTAWECNFQGIPGYMVSQYIDGVKVVEQFVSRKVYDEFCEAIGTTPVVVDASNKDLGGFQ